MAEVNYALIKNGNVINIAVFNEQNDELLSHFKKEFDLDELVLATNKASIGGTYDGKKFWLPQPYPSWVKGTEDWEAPVAKPAFDPKNPKFYTWDEDTLSWIEVIPPTE